MYNYLSICLPPPPPPYRVIVEAECVSDWNNKVKEIKRSFITFDEALCSARGESESLFNHNIYNIMTYFYPPVPPQMPKSLHPLKEMS